jgi:hypothetical protein
MDEDQAYIVLRRPSGHWRDSLRSYRVLLDGREVSKIKAGEELSLAVTPGRHNIAVKIDWGGSPTMDFELSPGRTLPLVAEPSDNAFAGFFSTDKWVKLRETSQ